MLQQYLEFLSRLKENNNREWFAAHKDEYQRIHAGYLLWIEKILYRMVDLDDTLQLLHSKDCVFRINRDIRFTKDKSPYKTKISGMFSSFGKSESSCGYYFEIDSTGHLMVGGGQYYLPPQDLFRVRQLILKNPFPLRDVLHTKEFQKTFGTLSGEQLKTHPKGFDPQSSELDLLKYKNYIATANFSVKNMADNEVADLIIVNFKAIKPLIKLLRSW